MMARCATNPTRYPMGQQMIMTSAARSKTVWGELPAWIPTTIAAAKQTKEKQDAITRAGMAEHSLLERTFR
ncbi:MAG: hypothetical protein Kow00105_11210 [Phycisphaeraceae bacterium]